MMWVKTSLFLLFALIVSCFLAIVATSMQMHADDEEDAQSIVIAAEPSITRAQHEMVGTRAAEERLVVIVQYLNSLP